MSVLDHRDYNKKQLQGVVRMLEDEYRQLLSETEEKDKRIAELNKQIADLKLEVRPEHKIKARPKIVLDSATWDKLNRLSNERLVEIVNYTPVSPKRFRV